MLTHYINVALRIFLRQKVYSFINVFGLAIGISTTLLISLYVFDELSYDRFHKDADRIFRIVSYGRTNGVESNHAMTGQLVAPVLQQEIPEIKSTTRLVKVFSESVVYYDDREFTEKDLIYADSNFFDFFSFHLIEGNAKEALRGQGKAVVSKSAALKYFGYNGTSGESPIGKLLLLSSSKTPVLITGIADDAPAQSHFHFNIIASLDTDSAPDTWIGYFRHTYIKTYRPEDAQAVVAKNTLLKNKYAEPEMRKLTGKSLKEMAAAGDYFDYHTQPLTSIHLDSHLNFELEPNGNRSYVYILAVIAVFVILLACINFTNLATARASNRAKEVGIRKASGALRDKLIKQFLTESFLYSALSVLFALGFVSLAIGPFNLLTEKQLTFNQLFSPVFIIGISGLLILVTILAGIYPAFYLTSFRPAEVLKGKIRSGGWDARVRNSLVVFQFVTSTALILTTLIIYQQIDFMQSHRTGFDQENIVCLSNAHLLGANRQAFKQELTAHPEIIAASFAARFPAHRFTQYTGYRRRGSDQRQTLSNNWADPDYDDVLGIHVKQGRFFSYDHPTDSFAVVINQAAADLMGIENLEHKQYIDVAEAGEAFEIIGIAEDFNFESLKSEVKPLIIHFVKPNRSNKMAIKVPAGNLQDKVALIQSVWSKYSTAPFEYTFLDENVAAQYKSEQLFGKITIIFTSLAVIIACIGLLGLVTYVASQRTKEIGIRKVLGASVQQIVVLLSKDFIRLVIVALVIAIPISWYGMNQWLQTFAYRIDFSFLVASIAGCMVVLIALVTVSYQSIKAAMGNPVDSLRSE